VANSKILEATDFQDAFIQPAAGDNGTSLGSALYVYHQLMDQPRDFVMNVDYCGPEFTDEEIGKELRRNGITYETPADISRAGAALLHQGKIIGWFQGRMEFGPRALGNRSILADPRTEKSRERLNEQIKIRESFRPYAPSVLREACGQYFEGRGDSPFMLKNFLVRPEKRALIPAVVHVDGSARVQTVERKQNPAFWMLIKEFENLSGIPVVLNTSFNGKGEAMVGTVKDALQCFYSTGLDALAIGSYLIRK
jgi:carbamoyltransferase